MNRTTVAGGVIAAVMVGIGGFALSTASSDATSFAASCGSPSYDGTNFSIQCTVPQATTTTTATATVTQTVTASASVSSTPTPTPTPTVSTTSPTPAGWPGASNTGVPAGVVLTAYTGSLNISCASGPVTITDKTINGNVEISGGSGTDPAAPCVSISDSLIKGRVHTAGDNPVGTGPVVLTDDEINVNTTTIADESGVQGGNIYLTRLNIHGFTGDGVHCDGNCTVTDSYAHDAVEYSSTHYNAFLSNGQVTGKGTPYPVTLRHNTWQCNMASKVSGASGGCSSDVAFYGDFGSIGNVTLDDNYFVGVIGPVTAVTPSFCLYSNTGNTSKMYPGADNFVVTNNVFGRGTGGYCGSYKNSAIGDWSYSPTPPSGPVNVWSGNTYDDGTPITQ